MKSIISKEIKTGILSAGLVDEFSGYTFQALKETNLSKKDMLRFRISVDTAMCTWLEKLGDGCECTFEMNKRFGRLSIVISCKGDMCNPQEAADEGFGNLENSSLLQTLGLSVGYSYSNGINYVKLMPGSGFIQQLMPILIAFALGIGSAFVLKKFFPAFATSFNTLVVDSVFNTLMGMLRAIASPLIFLAVLSGIYGIGDVTSLGTIGRKLIGRFVKMTFVALAITFLITIPMTNFSFGSYSANADATSDILNMVLQFIPSDIISPFLSGNMLQIITISVACGLIMLVLGERVSELSRIIDQLYSIVQLLMETIGRLVPFFIFISMLSLVLSNNNIQVKDILLPIIAVIGTFVLLGLVIYPAILKTKYHLKFSLLFKKLLPTFMIALTTASSAAAFSTNIETCEKKLGISSNVTRFGVPLGQVVFMPIAAAEYFIFSILFANNYGVSITPMWVATAFFVSGILSIATPPIPGGGLSIFTILFIQLGIPSVALPIALGIDMLIDYIITAGDIMCLQEELIICGGKTNFLDQEVLLLDKD